MEDLARAVLTGIAIGGFAAAVVEVNILAVKTLLHFNHLAAETAWEMSKGVARGQNNPYVYHTMSDNKLVKSILDAATITGLVAGIGWIGRKIIKEDLTKDPSANAMNYVKFTAVMAGSIALKKYLEDQKILPANT